MAARKKSTSVLESEEIFKKVAKEITEIEMSDYVEESFLPYAWSVCLDRALSYTSDGLKPIQRRILFTAYKCGLTDKSAKMKSATFDGKVMEFSPHGGSYGSIVNMATPETESQPRDLRVPLISGKGNWGSLDSAPAAARYTEMNLTPAAMELLSELSENAVDMVPNYNNTCDEPIHLPARWPVGIINGIPSAMAVGFACNIPSHNPDEIMDACIALAKNPNMDSSELCKIIKGPDFNCGCDIIATTIKDGKPENGIKSYINTGSGTFIMKAKYELKEENGKNIINFYNLPYKIGPEKIIESIKAAYEKGSFKELESWKNLSDFTHPVNVEIITKKGVNVSKTISELYKKTPLQCSFSANCVMIDNNSIPKKQGIKEHLNEFLEFRKECTIRKLNYRLDDRKKKLHIQQAIAAVIIDIDKCISIIRSSTNSSTASKALMKAFSIDEEQASYILGMQLRKLTKSDSLEVKAKIKDLEAEINKINSILNDKNKFIDFIVKELESTKASITSKRRCKILVREKNDVEEKDIFISYNKDFTKIKRSFTKSQSSYKVDNSGRVLVLLPEKAIVKSIYEIEDNKELPLSRFKLGAKTILAVPNDGYLVLIGEMGALKIVDLEKLRIPNKDSIDKLLSQPLFSAFLTKNNSFTITLNHEKGKTAVKSDIIPTQSISANGRKFGGNKLVTDYSVVFHRK